MNYGIYIHVPFCRRKCDYCAFFSRPLSGGDGDARLLDRYTERLVAECRERLVPLAGAAVESVYLGGGTPSLLGPERLWRILEALRGSVSLAVDAEVTLELNPGDAGPATVERYRDAGVTRAVLGLQTVVPESHRRIGRSTPIPTMTDLDRFFAVAGIQHCLDLIIGIPGSERSIETDLAVIERFRPDHVSAYLLSLEAGTPLARVMSDDERFDELQRHQYRETIDRLKSLGYRHYEIANFCLPGRECRHNLRYWQFKPYVGLGPGAHSFYDNERYVNLMGIEDYCDSYRVVLTHDARTAGAPVVEYLMTGLRLIDGISIAAMERTLGMPLPLFVRDRMQQAAREGLLTMQSKDGDDVVCLTDEGLFLADAVIYEIVQDIL